MRIRKFLVTGLVGLSLVGCTTEGGQKQQVGTLLGAAGGALLGAQVGSGTGQLVGVAAGTLLGAMLGQEIGRSLDRADRAAMSRAEDEAYRAPVGDTISWNNPQSGNYGTVTPVRDGTSSSGRYCREFQQTVTIGGRVEEAYGTACRQPDGSWEIVQN